MFVPTTRESIAKLLLAGHRQPEIARRLNLAPTTVSYHVQKILADVERAATDADTPALISSGTRDAVAHLLSKGCSHAEIAARLGISKPTVTYHARRLGSHIDLRAARRYDWAQVQRYYDEGHSIRDCMRAFGFSSTSWSDAVKRGAIVARPNATPLSELLVAGTYRGRYNLKSRLIKEGLKTGCCERCGLEAWRGAQITMALHHINGDRLDNRLENLELLCPNCHSQTDTYAGRNGRRRSARADRAGRDSAIDAEADQAA
jgi:DNA-binding CsgD family transcriptional regulator